MMTERKCEWKDHEGNPYENQGGGKGSTWWLKDPEWVWLCPKCWDNYWSKFRRDLRKEKGAKG